MTAPEVYLQAIEAELQARVAAQAGGPPLLLGMIRYHMGWIDQDFQPFEGESGKRIRPLLLLLAAESVGGRWEQALPAAASVELLHNFTLIHDDIEDRDTLRRGRPTLWSLWGIPQAINAGDALFAISCRTLLALPEQGVPHPQVVRALRHYSEAVIGITEGQCMDLAFEDTWSVDEETYLRMVQGKTARLLGLSAELGGLIAGAPDQALAALREFGEAMGMAFQMLDDVLGLWGDPSETGKPVGSDLQNRKKTYPIIHGMQHSAPLRALLASSDLGPNAVTRAMQELAATGSRAYTESAAARYHHQAVRALDRAGTAGPARDDLLALAERLLLRQR